VAWSDHPVLTRELRRLSRRRKTWVARVATASVGFALVASSQQTQLHDVAQLASRASLALHALTLAALWIVVLTVPMSAAQAVEEERTDHSLDLLVLTPLPRGRVLWGKVGSRLTHTALFLAGGLPVLGLLSTFGAIAPLRLVNLAANLLLLGILLAQVATCLVVAQRGGPLVAAAATLCWLFGVSFVASLGFMVDPAWPLSPLQGMFHDDLAGCLPWAVWSPVVVVHAWLGPLLFRLTTGESGDDELGLLSPEVWTLRRYERRVAALLAVAVACTGVLLLVASLGLQIKVWSAVAVVLWTWTFAVTGLLVLQAVTSQLRTAGLRARRAAAQRRGLAERRRTVGRWPLLWRLLRTNLGGGATAVRRTAVAVVALATLGTPLVAGFGQQDAWLFPMVVSWSAACIVATLLPLATTATDRSPRTRELLVLAGQSARSIVWAHLSATAVAVAPLVALGSACLGLAVFGREPGYAWSGNPSAVTSITLLLATSAACTAATSTAIGLLAASRAVWVLGVSVGLLQFFGLPVLGEFVGAEGPIGQLFEVWSPLLEGRSHFGSPELGLVMSSTARVAVATVVIGWATWRLGRSSR